MPASRAGHLGPMSLRSQTQSLAEPSWFLGGNRPTRIITRSSAVAEKPRDASCHRMFREITHVTQGHSKWHPRVSHSPLDVLYYWSYTNGRHEASRDLFATAELAYLSLQPFPWVWRGDVMVSAIDVTTPATCSRTSSRRQAV